MPKLATFFAKKQFLILILILVTAGFLFYRDNLRDSGDLLKCADCNVLIVAFDAEQAGHVGALGYSKNTSPVQDSLAKSGFLFTNAIAQSSWTVPSFMSFFTSLYPSEHKLTNKYTEFSQSVKTISNIKNLAPTVQTLAEVFQRNGYATAGFTGDAGVGAGFGYNKGFDVYVDSQTPFGGFEASIPPALEWLKNNKDKKFFMFLHSYSIHGQNDPAEGYTKKFLDFNYAGPLQGGKAEQAKLREEGLAKGKLALTEEDYKFWRALYDEKIYNADKKFGEFLTQLDGLDLTKKTIIIVLSDHGTEIGEHQRFDHGFSLYDELIHVPLIIKLPQKISKVVDNQVRAIDLMPTVLELVGLPVDEKIKNQMKGESLVSLMRGQKTGGRDAFSETDYRNYTHKKSLRTSDGWKFIYTFEDDTRELYNLKSDPGETKNLVEQEPKLAYELEQKLFQYIKDSGQDVTKLKEVGCLPVYGEVCTEKTVK